MPTVGFTGTRKGCTPPQMEALARILAEWLSEADSEFHHGCCIGADAQAVAIVRKYVNMAHVVAHPGDWPPLQSQESIASSNEVLRCRPNLTRNQDIVNACDPIIACPEGPEKKRSGTWFTIRCARNAGKRIVIVHPDGDVVVEGA